VERNPTIDIGQREIDRCLETSLENKVPARYGRFMEAVPLIDIVFGVDVNQIAF
jgi:hypothetical protein